jgi:carbonic anhydrase
MKERVMRSLRKLFEQNRAWAAKLTAKDPEFFLRLSRQQAPDYLWIGCADSRVPANDIVDLMPGEMFVHRNVANVVIPSDLNCLSVMQYAVEVLHVEHIIVCGHYGCGGVRAAMLNSRHGLIDNWLRHVQDVMKKHAATLDPITDEEERLHRLCELNVLEQVNNVGRTTVVQEAWERGQKLELHGWIYSITDGLLQDLVVNASSDAELDKTYQAARHTLGE